MNIKYFEPASLGKRLLAYIIDTIIVVSICIGVGVITRSKPLAELTLIFCSVFYFAIPTYIYGKTIGKKLVGLVVVSTNSEKRNIFWILVRETFGKYLSYMVLGIGYIWILFNEESRGWHDLISNTLVADTRSMKKINSNGNKNEKKIDDLFDY